MGFRMPDQEPSRGGYTTKGGWAHVVAEKGEGEQGKSFNQAWIHCAVLAHEDAAQVNTRFKIKLAEPDESHKDGGAFAAEKMYFTAKAFGVLPNAKPGEVIEIPWEQVAGRQVILLIETSTGQDGKIYADLDGSQIYPLEAAEVRDKPRNLEAAKLAGNGKPAPQQPAQQPQPQPAATSGGLDDIGNLFG